jgi:hypothetical protein
VRLANGRVFRLGKRPGPVVVKPGVPIEPPAQILDLLERRQPGALPPWFKAPAKPGKHPKTNTKEPAETSRPERAPRKAPTPARHDLTPASPLSSRYQMRVNVGPEGRDEFLRVQNNPLPPQAEIPGLSTRRRDQGARDSCTWFASTLGLEAAYIRLAGTDVDLSEQYFNNILKLHLIYPDKVLPTTEVQEGLWGGGSVVTNLKAMRDLPFAVPEESELPYLSLANQVSPSPPGDILNPPTDPIQHAVDDFSILDTPVTLANPPGLVFTPLPVGALENAAYRSTFIEIASGADLSSLDWYRQRLSSGEAIAIGFYCCGDFGSGPDPVWKPVGHLSFAHAALLIGYNDNKQAFLLRNSWNENTARWFSYDFVTTGQVYDAVDIKSVATIAKPKGLPDNRAVLLGRWWLTDAGQPGRLTPNGTGVLDVYRLPGANGITTVDRLGTFFAENGSAYRVNGQFFPESSKPPGRLEFFIDPATPDASFTATGGARYIATYMFETTSGNQHRMMVGTASTGGAAARQFILRKAAPLPVSPTTSLSGPRPADQQLIGSWDVYWEGEIGSLVFTRFDTRSGKFIGTYQPGGGQPMTAWGAVNGNGIVVLTDLPSLRLAAGAFTNANLSVASGHGQRSNPASAFVAVLRSPVPAPIVIPAVSDILGPAAP